MCVHFSSQTSQLSDISSLPHSLSLTCTLTHTPIQSSFYHSLSLSLRMKHAWTSNWSFRHLKLRFCIFMELPFWPEKKIRQVQFIVEGFLVIDTLSCTDNCPKWQTRLPEVHSSIRLNCCHSCNYWSNSNESILVCGGDIYINPTQPI